MSLLVEDKDRLNLQKAAKINKNVNETKIDKFLSAKKSKNSANRISVFGHSELCDLKMIYSSFYNLNPKWI